MSRISGRNTHLSWVYQDMATSENIAPSTVNSTGISSIALMPLCTLQGKQQVRHSLCLFPEQEHGPDNLMQNKQRLPVVNVRGQPDPTECADHCCFRAWNCGAMPQGRSPLLRVLNIGCICAGFLPSSDHFCFRIWQQE